MVSSWTTCILGCTERKRAFLHFQNDLQKKRELSSIQVFSKTSHIKVASTSYSRVGEMKQ
jgi:hypothetical protein